MNSKLKVGIIRIALLIVLVVLSQGTVFAQGCSVQMSMDPTPPFTLGTHVQLHVWGNCGTVRFEINGQPRAEIGTTEQRETWKTEEFGSGNFEVCGVGRGSGGWENASRSCRTVYVAGSQAQPPGSNPGSNVRCWVNSFTVTPGSANIGHTFQFAGSGQCDGNARAARFYIGGNPWGEYGGNTTSSSWNTSGQSAGTYEICFGITGGEWSQEARSCTNITLSSSGGPSNNTSQGPQTNNNQPGQTNQSGPGNQNNPPVQNNQPPNQNNNADNGGSSGNSGGSSGGSGGGNSSNNGGDTGYGTNSSDPTFSQPCVSSRLRVGDIAIVNPRNEYVRLRSSARVDASTLTTIPSRSQITLIGGPVCSHAWQWYETQYNGFTGWVAEIGPDGDSQRNLLRNGEALPGSSGSSGSGSSSGSGGNSNTTTCNGAVQVSLTVGGRGRVTPGDPNRLRSGVGTGQSQIDTIPGNGEFQVVGGPRCADGYQWWQVEYNGQTGWTVAGGNGQAWVVSLGGGNNNQPQPTPVLQGNQVETIQFYYAPWGRTYQLEVTRTNHCVVRNGSTIIAREIERVGIILDSMNLAQRVNFMIEYFSLNTGGIEQFRLRIQRQLGCSNFSYQVGERNMDESGLGNIIYGYALERWSDVVESVIARLFQGRRDKSLHPLILGDNPDDVSQRSLGATIARLTNQSASPSTSTVEQAAVSVGLF